MRLQIPTPGNSITEHIRRAYDERDVISWIRAGYCIVRQGRLPELLHGVYCEMTARAAALRPHGADLALAALSPLERHLTQSATTLSRHQLIDAFQNSYAVVELPNDFHGCRSQAIAKVGPQLVLGEYGTNAARLAVVSRDRCLVFDPYVLARGVRHIHLVCPTGVTDEVFVTTGDAMKVLDRYTIAGGTLRLVLRHRARLAGYTAVAQVGGHFFFGTDFSGRPNYIETLQGDRYFFPAAAYRQWVVSLTPLGQRYLVAVGRDIFADLGGHDSRTVSVFDARERTFVLCTRWSALVRARNAWMSTVPPGAGDSIAVRAPIGA